MFRLVLLAAALVLAAPPAEARGDRAAGRQKAVQVCQGCHGLNGVSTLPDGPHLAGQNEIYLVKALKDYKSGARKDERMSVVIETMSEKDIQDVSAYYASLEPRN